MFCDLVGSTALSTGMDPEDLRDVITSFQNRCSAAIRRYDGLVAKYMGDGILVYFGYPRAALARHGANPPLRPIPRDVLRQPRPNDARKVAGDRIRLAASTAVTARARSPVPLPYHPCAGGSTRTCRLGRVSARSRPIRQPKRFLGIVEVLVGYPRDRLSCALRQTRQRAAPREGVGVLKNLAACPPV